MVCRKNRNERRATLAMAALALAVGACNEVKVQRPLKPPPQIRAVSDYGGVRIEWAAVPGAAGYVVYFSNLPLVDTTSAPSVESTRQGVRLDATPGAAIHAVVTALSDGNESAPSFEVSALALGDPFGALLDSLPGEAPGGAFGTLVLAPDLTQDGRADVVATAPNADGGLGRSVFFVGNPGAPLDAGASFAGVIALGRHGSVGASGDLDGDGYPNVVIGAPEGASGRLAIHEGWAGGLTPLPGMTRPAEIWPTSVSIGDFDGDGFGDLATGGYGTLQVYFGSESLFPPIPTGFDWDAVGLGVGTSDGPVIAAFVGDLDGNGCDDLAVGEPFFDAIGGTDSGRLQIYMGGLVPSTSPVDVVDGLSPVGRFGYAVAALGDVNGDGFPDFAAGNRPDTEGAAAWVFHGGAPPTLDAFFLSNDVANPLAPRSLGLAPAGDVNGDGFDDVLVGAPFAGEARLYLGGTDGQGANPFWTLPGASGESFAESLALGDLDADGAPDLVVGSPQSGNGLGYLRVFSGNPRGIRVDAGDWFEVAPSNGEILYVTFHTASFEDPVPCAHECTWDGINDGSPFPCTPGNVGDPYVGVPNRPGAYRLKLTVSCPNDGRAGTSVTTVVVGGGE